jgi:hypothetical protein
MEIIVPIMFFSECALRSTYQVRHVLAYDDYRIDIEEEIKTDPKSEFFLGMLILRKNVLVILSMCHEF